MALILLWSLESEAANSTLQGRSRQHKRNSRVEKNEGGGGYFSEEAHLISASGLPVP